MSSDQVIPKLFSNILRAASLTHFMLLLSFYTSWKHQKIIDFHKVKKVTWHKMGYRQIECLAINTPRRSLQQMYFKIDVLKNLSNFTGKKLCWNLFLIKLQDGMQLYQKETAAQGFPCEICNIFQNIFFYRTPPIDASETPFFGEEGIFRRLFWSGSDKAIGNKCSESFQNVSVSL